MADLVTIGFAVDTGQLSKANRELNNLSKSGATADKSVDKVNSSVSMLNKTLGVAGTLMTGVFAGASIQSIARGSDAWKNLNSQIRQVTESEQELLTVRNQLMQVADDTRTDIEATVKLYSSLDRATSALGVTSQEQINITRTINNLFLSSGASADDAASAIRQLGQALEAGALRGDEFNSIAENAPRIMDALAKNLKMTRGELREFAATGGITAKIIVDALSGFSEEAQKAADMTEKTFAQSMVVAGGNMAELAGRSKVLSGAIGGLGDAAIYFSNTLATNVEYVEAYFGRFSLWADDSKRLANSLGEAFSKVVSDSSKAFPAVEKNANTLFDNIIDGFKALPDTLRAFVQLMGVELAFLIDLAGNYGAAFVEALQVHFFALIDKAKVWGAQLKDALNPFSDSTQDFAGDIAAIESTTEQAINSIFDAANEKAVQSKSIRLSVIEDILQANQRAKADYQEEIKLIDNLNTSTADLNKSTSSLASNVNNVGDALKKGGDDADEWLKITERAADRIDQAFVDVFMNIGDGFSSLTNGLKNAFKQMLAEMAVQAMKANFLNPLMGGISGLGLGGTAGLLGGLSNSFSALGSLFSGGLAGLSLGGIGAALPAVGLIAGGASLVNSLTGGGLFGTSYKATGSELNLGFGSGGAFGSTVLEESKKRALFGGTKRRYTTTGIDTSGIDAAFDAVQESILYGAEILGVGTAEAALSNFTAALKTDITGKSEAEVQQIINDWISSTTNSMVSAGLGSVLNEFQKEGEPLTETLMRVVAQTEVFNSVIDSLWLNFEGTSQAAAMAADNLVNLVGGLDQFAALNNQLMGFASSADQWQIVYKDIYATFTQLSMKIPDTREEFFDLMQGIDLTTESGQELYSMLLKLVPNLDKWYTLEEEKERNIEQQRLDKLRMLEQEAEAEKRLNDQRKNLTIQLLEAQGKSEEAVALAREMELATLDPTLQALMQQIYAEQDRQKALEENKRKLEEYKAKEIELIEQQKDALTELYNTLVANVEFAESEVEKARQKELERLDLVITKAEEAYNLELEAINKQRDEYYQLIDDLTAKTDESAARVEQSRQAEIEAIESVYKAAQDKYSADLQALNDQAVAEQELYNQLLVNVDSAMSALDAARNAELEAINNTIAELNEKYSAELALIDEAEKAESDRYQQVIKNVEAAKGALERARQAEINSINNVLAEQLSAYDLQLNAIAQQRDAYNQLLSSLQSNVSSAGSALEKSLSVELAKYDELIKQAQDASNAEINAINASSSARLSALNAERNIIEQISRQYGAAARSVSVSEALAAARSGNFEPATRLQTGGNYSDSVSARIGAAREAFALAEIGKLADAQLSDTDRQISSIESSSQAQINAINALLQSNVEQIEADKLAVEQQVKELLGIDDSVLSLEAAIAAYQMAQDELQAAIADDTLTSLTAQEELIKQQIEQTKLDAENQIAALNSQIDALLGIDNSVLSVSDAINLLKESQQAESEFLRTDFEAQRQALESSYQAQTDALNIQAELLNSQINALLGIDNSVLSVADAIAKLEIAQQELGGFTQTDFASQKAVLDSILEQARLSAESQIDTLNNQVNALLGIDTSVLALSDAIAAYTSAQQELETALNSDTLAQLQAQEDAALEQLNAIIEQTNQEADLLNKQIDELLNIDNSVMELQSAIDLLLSERQALAELEYDKQVEDFEAQLRQIEKLEFINDSVQEVVAAVAGLNSYVGGLVAQIPSPDDKWQTPPIIILPPVEESAVGKEISGLREDMKYAQQSIAKSSATTAKILQRIELDGLQVIP